MFRKEPIFRQEATMNKKVVIGAAVTVAAASVATNLAFQPEELLHSAEYLDAQTRYVEDGQLGEEQIEFTEAEQPNRWDVFRSWLIRLPVPVKAALLMPLWVLGALPGTTLFSALSPIAAQLFGLVAQMAVLVGVFCVVYKLIFPDRRLSELFSRKNRRWLLLGASVLTAANFGLSLAWPGWHAARIVVMGVVGFGVLCLLWYRICGRLKAPKPGVVRSTLKLEY